MIPAHRIPAHPGKILKRNFSTNSASVRLHLLHTSMFLYMDQRNCAWQAGITSETAWLLAQSLDTTPSSGSTSRQHTTWPCIVGEKDRETSHGKLMRHQLNPATMMQPGGVSPATARVQNDSR
jgi:hypothetical protein